MLYVYAIAERSASASSLGCGLEDAGVFVVVRRSLAAVVSRIAVTDVPVTRANLWRHEAIAEALMAEGTVLPLRFGTVVADEQRIGALLEAHYAELAGDLDRLRGCVELGLRLLWDPGSAGEAYGKQTPPPPRGSSESSFRETRPFPERKALGSCGSARGAGEGRAYLLRATQRRRGNEALRLRAEALARDVHARLAAFAVHSTFDLLRTPGLLLTAEFLVVGKRVPEFLACLRRLDAERSGLRFFCTGPWPPYTFVTASLALGKEGGKFDA